MPQMTLTAEIKNLIKGANSVCFDFEQIPNPQSFETDKCNVTIRISTGKRGAVESDHRFPGFVGWIGTGFKDETITHPRHGEFPPHTEYLQEPHNYYKPTRGVVSFITASYDEHLQAVFRAIPVNSELTFRYRLDYGTNQYHTLAKLHGDIFYMTAQPPTPKHARKQPHAMTFKLEETVGPHNTSRFGCPGSHFY